VGDSAPDFPADYIYWSVNASSAAIGSSGHIAFSGAADTSIFSTENNTSAVWAGFPGQLKAIIRENESPVGFPANVLFQSTAPATTGGGAVVRNILVSQSGSVGFSAALKGAGQGQQALLAHVNGTTYGVLRTNDPAPGFSSGTLFSFIGSFAFSDAGMVVTAFLRGSPSGDTVGVWLWTLEGLQLISSPIAGCKYLLPPLSSINQSGEIALSASLIGNDNQACIMPNGKPLSGVGIFKWRNGSWEILVTSEDPVPGMPNVNFTLLPTSPPQINDQGEVAFSAQIENDVFARKGSLWVKINSGDPKLIVLAGETLARNQNDIIADLPSPFFNAGISENNFSMIPVSTTAGTLALMAGFPKINQPYTSLDETGESQLTTVARLNAKPPGFESTWFYSWLLGQASNRNNQFFFTGRITEAVSNNEITAFWRGKDNESPRLKAMDGMKINVNGEERVLEQIFAIDSNRRNVPGKTLMVTGRQATQFSDNGHFIFAGKLSGGNLGLFQLLDDSQEQRIFALAEQLFPNFFFPSNVDDRLIEGFEYRFYPTTNTYIGIKNGNVFVLGDAFEPGVTKIGTIDGTLGFLEAEAKNR
jgi:hypothetical protein